MKSIFLTLFIFISCYCAAGTTTGTGVLLARLDSLLADRAIVEQRKTSRISDLERKRSNARTDEELYWANNALYAELCYYSADAAMRVVDENISIAQKLGNKEWLTRMKIRRSFVMAASGLLNEALEVIGEIDPTDISPELRKEYYQQMVYLYSHLGTYAGSYSSEEGQRFYAIEREYKDSLAIMTVPSDVDYLWNTGWNSQDDYNGDRRPIISEIEQHLAKSELNSLDDAKNAYILAILYKAEGDMEGYMKALIMSSIADVTIANRDVASMQDLARHMMDTGDIERAYAYSDYCLGAAISYPNRVRAMTIMPLQRNIANAAITSLNKRNSTLTGVLTALCILAAGLVASLLFIALQKKQLRVRGERLNQANASLESNVEELRGVQQQLAEANEQLKKLNEDLKENNEQLAEANYVKEEYIGYVFSMCSQYIRKIDDFRRTVNRKIIAKQYTDIKQMTDGPARMRDELKEFYHNFDTIFLHIYPDFIDDFNTLMLPENRIIPREGELLNTELRIYALVRLGITDSVKIAEFLHCSPQTVYNNRFRVRTAAAIPREQFAAAVRALGRPSNN